jgi:hypothetical protein
VKFTLGSHRLCASFRDRNLGPKRHPVNRQRSAPYDPELLVNWTVARLRKELSKINVRVPLNSQRMTLVQLLCNDNEESARSHIASGQNVNNEIVVDQSQDASCTNNHGNNRASILTELVSKLSSTVQSLQQSVTTLNNRVNIISRNVIQTRNENATTDIQTSSVRSSGQSTSQSSELPYSLQTAYTAMDGNSSTIRNRPTAATGSETQARDLVDRGQYV